MSKKILIAEDDQFLNKMYKLHFEDNEDYEVDTVHNGEEALKKIEESAPDLLILDLLMPKMDGFTVLEKLQGKLDFPVIILTNLSQKADEARCKELGASDFFVKSDVDLDDLSAKVKKHI